MSAELISVPVAEYKKYFACSYCPCCGAVYDVPVPIVAKCECGCKPYLQMPTAEDRARKMRQLAREEAVERVLYWAHEHIREYSVNIESDTEMYELAKAAIEGAEYED